MIRRNLTNPPNVRAENPTRDFPIRSTMNFSRKGGAACVDPVLIKHSKSSAHAPRVDSTSLGESHVLSGGNDDLHEIQYRTFCEFGKREVHNLGEIAENAMNADTFRMAQHKKPRDGDPWAQRPRFIELLDEKIKNGTTPEEIAAALKLKTTSSLDVSYRYDRSRKPERKVMELAAAFFNVPLSELYGETAPVTEIEKARAAVKDAHAGGDISSFTDEQVLNVYKAMLAVARAMLIK